eukprot:679914-Hanusia_phi.AAC.4
MPVLISNIMSCIANFKVHDHESVFELVKQKTIVDYRNRRFQQSYFHCVTATNHVLEHPFWSNEERLKELETLTGAEVQDFLKEFLDSLLIEAFVVGNFTADEAVKLITESLFPLQPKALDGDGKPCLCITQASCMFSCSVAAHVWSSRSLMERPGCTRSWARTPTRLTARSQCTIRSERGRSTSTCV